MNILHENRKARFDYFIEHKFIAGIILEGWEVKQILNKQCSLTGAFIKIENGEMFIEGMQVLPSIQTSSHVNPSIFRKRKLLLNKTEIAKLYKDSSQKGFTIIPLDIHYSDSKKIKLTIAICKGKSNNDKRDAIAERDTARRIERLL